MTNLEQAKMNRNNALLSYLNDNAAVTASNLPFTTQKDKTSTDVAACILAASKAGADNTGFSEEKLAAKTAMARLAAQLCGYAQVKFDLLEKYSLSEQLNESETFYLAAADAEAGARALAAVNVMTENISDLTDYVSASQLDDLTEAIGEFMQAEGSSGSVHSASPALTQAFKSALKKTDIDVKNITKLGKFYELSNPGFYEGLLEVCQIPTVNVHHTNVDLTLHDSVDGTPIANATASLSNSSKTGTSDATGFLHIDHVQMGNATLSITCTGYEPLSMLIHILNGHDNSFNLQMVKL